MKTKKHRIRGEFMSTPAAQQSSHEQRSTKFCENCGAQIDIRAEICPKCGVRVEPAGFTKSTESSSASKKPGKGRTKAIIYLVIGLWFVVAGLIVWIVAWGSLGAVLGIALFFIGGWLLQKTVTNW